MSISYVTIFRPMFRDMSIEVRWKYMMTNESKRKERDEKYPTKTTGNETKSISSYLSWCVLWTWNHIRGSFHSVTLKYVRGYICVRNERWRRRWWWWCWKERINNADEKDDENMITELSFFSSLLAKDHSLDRNNHEKYISLCVYVYLSLRTSIARYIHT